ncbi:hypothetical protein PsorP6_006066 [Peronosclerospora sorghi]|uniref:Uncharacterized protein n=1 Tax=Peronosclerospora sorghi TaxID=230839 RepID=A0ACC0W3I9_9STRA|nr:hypothetical protein PsorP6_006066 [Peronosclerospora sorghi]
MFSTAKFMGEFGDVNFRASSSQDGNHSERDDSSSSEVTGAAEEEYDASDSSSDHGSFSVECGSNVGLDDNHSTADDEGGINEEERPDTATAYNSNTKRFKIIHLGGSAGWMTHNDHIVSRNDRAYYDIGTIRFYFHD